MFVKVKGPSNETFIINTDQIVYIRIPNNLSHERVYILFRDHQQLPIFMKEEEIANLLDKLKEVNYVEHGFIGN